MIKKIPKWKLVALAGSWETCGQNLGGVRKPSPSRNVIICSRESIQELIVEHYGKISSELLERIQDGVVKSPRVNDRKKDLFENGKMIDCIEKCKDSLLPKKSIPCSRSEIIIFNSNSPPPSDKTRMGEAGRGSPVQLNHQPTNPDLTGFIVTRGNRKPVNQNILA
jgi:hypothetical protein